MGVVQGFGNQFEDENEQEVARDVEDEGHHHARDEQKRQALENK